MTVPVSERTAERVPAHRQDDAAHTGADQLAGKELRLRACVASLGPTIVAFSGGVDSAYLAYVANDVLGSGALCVTADSPSYPDRHRQLALLTARDLGLRHEIIHTAEMERDEYRANPVNRCYYCKHELYTTLSRDRLRSRLRDDRGRQQRG